MDCGYCDGHVVGAPPAQRGGDRPQPDWRGQALNRREPGLLGTRSLAEFPGSPSRSLAVNEAVAWRGGDGVGGERPGRVRVYS